MMINDARGASLTNGEIGVYVVGRSKCKNFSFAGVAGGSWSGQWVNRGRGKKLAAVAKRFGFSFTLKMKGQFRRMYGIFWL